MKHLLFRVPLFRAVPAAKLNALNDTAELRRFRKGETLFEEGQAAESVWLIQRGWVYLVKRTPQGIQATIFTVTPEEVVCGVSAVVGHGAYYASAVAATDTTAIRVPHTAFAHLVRSQADFAERLLAIYHTRMRRMAEAISLAQAPVEQRVIYTLLRLRSTFGHTLPITHQELSRMAGTRIETSIRVIAGLKRKGWLSTSRGKMVILRSDQLSASLQSVKHDLHHGTENGKRLAYMR